MWLQQEEDAADRKERLKKQKEAEAAARLKLMSQPLQRGLPRPNHKTLAVHADVAAGSTALEQASALVEAEIGAIVAYEAGAYPTKGKPKKKDKLPPRDDFSREKMESAKLMILEESMEDPRAKVDIGAFERVWADVTGDVVKSESGDHGSLVGLDEAGSGKLTSTLPCL